MPTNSITPNEIQKAIERLASSIVEKHQKTEKIVIAGIANGGIVLSERLVEILNKQLGKVLEHGIINISFHRDDLSDNPIPKSSASTILDKIENSALIIIDDVMFTGRSVRAAINEVFDQGRPQTVELVTLVDRGHRDLPIQPDYCGFKIDTNPTDQVMVLLHSNTEEQSKDSIQVISK
tara:strand:- start:244 stop:780 length:537 start_codon:yes stop_codon:yes gene_type:complete